LLNPLNAKLNLICHLLALLGAPNIFHVSGLRVKVCGQDTSDASSFVRNRDAAAAGVAALLDKLQSGRTCTAVMRHNIRWFDEINFGDCCITTDEMCST